MESHDKTAPVQSGHAGSPALRQGIRYGVGCYVTWGLFPLYLRSLRHVPALELICHRIVWSCLLLAGIVVFSGRGPTLRSRARAAGTLLRYCAAAGLIAVNWLLYVWGVNAGFIVEVSLGYFINPLVSVLLGVLFLRERLRPWQLLAVALAAVGVLSLAFAYGSPPWLALTLACSFGLYGLLKKTARLGALDGLTLETALLFLPALGYLLWAEWVGRGAFVHTGALSGLLLVGAGPVTAIPLLLFAAAVQRIPLSLVGVLQYIAPTLQFLLGVLVYGEPVTHAQLTGFGLVWTALVIFGIEGLVAHGGSRGKDPSDGQGLPAGAPSVRSRPRPDT
jgi:chloramphenicol-sensitive protein RarD